MRNSHSNSCGNAMAARSGCLLCVLLVLLAIDSTTADAPVPNDGKKPCHRQLGCVSSLSCNTVDKLITAFESNVDPIGLSSSHLHLHQPSHYKQSATENKAFRNRRDTSALKKLLGIVPEEQWRSEESKLEGEIDVIEKAEEMLEADLDHLKHAKHTKQHSEKKSQLEDELVAMKKLDAELIEQKEVIKDSLESADTEETGPEDSSREHQTTDEQYADDYEYSEYSDSEESRTDWREDSEESDYAREDSEFDGEAVDGQSDYKEYSEEEYSEESSEYDYSESTDYSEMDYSDTEYSETEYSDYSSDRNKRTAPSLHQEHKRTSHYKPRPIHDKGTTLMEKIKSVEELQEKLAHEIDSLEEELGDRAVSRPPPAPVVTKPEQPPRTLPPPPTLTEHSHHPHHSRPHNRRPSHHHSQHAPSSNHKQDLTSDDIVSSLVNSLSDTSQVKVTRGRDGTSLQEGSLEQRVLHGVQQGKSEVGLSVDQAVSLQREAETLEHKESDIVEELVHEDKAGNKLDDLEKRVVLEELLQELDSMLEDKISKNKQSSHRHVRSVPEELSDDSRMKRYAPWVSALEKQRDVPFEPILTPASNGATYHYHTGESTGAIREKRAPHKHHKGHKAHHHKHHSSNEGHKDMDRCARCEAMVGEEVCGRNGKTYNSLCHAINCGGLREEDVSVAPCALDDVCEGVECGEGSECVTLTSGVCLILYSTQTHKRLTCRQYMCVTEGDCTSDAHSAVCGLNGKTYPSLCHLHKAGVGLAYSGTCRPQLCRNSVCGRDGVTYTSVCHARARAVRVDYPGACFAESEYPQLHGCADVVRAGRCPKLACNGPVLPMDSCCPICGGALVVHPDTKAVSALVSTWKDVNHMYIVENFLRKLLSDNASRKCELSATLTNAGNISVVLESIKAKDYTVCQASAKDLATAINGHVPEVEDSMLRPMAKTAALMDALNPWEKINSFMQETKDKVVSGVEDQVNEGIQHAEEETSRLENQHLHSHAPPLSPHSLTVTGLLLTVYSTVQCII